MHLRTDLLNIVMLPIKSKREMFFVTNYTFGCMHMHERLRHDQVMDSAIMRCGIDSANRLLLQSPLV